MFNPSNGQRKARFSFKKSMWSHSSNQRSLEQSILSNSRKKVSQIGNTTNEALKPVEQEDEVIVFRATVTLDRRYGI